MKQQTIAAQLTAVENLEQTFLIKKNMLLEKALHSTHPADVIKAAQVVNGIEKRHTSEKKTYIVDPYEFNNSFGYKDKPFALSYEMLKRISFATPIIRAIIGTRTDQIASFCEPQSDKYSTGFVIRKKQPYYTKASKAATREEIATANKLTDFMLNCGMNNSYMNDDFDGLVRKLTNDSYTYDQMTFEIVNDRRGKPWEFLAADASTMRIADSYDDDAYKKGDRQEVMGYLPSYCQILDGTVSADYYPWELCFGVRNPISNVFSNGYGVSEIEILMNTITSMLWSDEYNRKFFSQGSAPKGFFKFKSETDVNGTRLQQFKQQFQGMMSGVQNAWKTPVLQGDIEWQSMQESNQDMEFSKWQEYLIKITTAIYRIDPAEINFPLSGGSEKAMFEGNNEARLKHSKDKGLFPALKFYQRKWNKMIISRLNPEYEFVYVGMDGMDEATELKQDIDAMSNFMTVDEIRIKRGLTPIGEEKGGNNIANSVIQQALNAKLQAEQQEKQMQQQGQPGAEGEDDEDFDENSDDNYEENPFEKAFDTYVQSLNKEDESRAVISLKKSTK